MEHDEFLASSESRVVSSSETIQLVEETTGKAINRYSVLRRWSALAILLLTQFMLILDSSIVNVALPSIQHGLGFSSASLRWVLTAYTLALGGFLLLGGRFADLFGRRVFFVGLGLFTLASLLGGIAQSPAWLIAMRAVQGLGAAIVTPVVLPLIMQLFTDSTEQQRALGLFIAFGASGFSAGSLLGGVLTGWLGWRSVLFVNVPVGILAILLALPLLPKSPHVNRRIDVAGALLVTCGSTLLVYGISETTTAGWLSWQTLASLIGALVLLTGFVIVELRVKEPLIDFSLFSQRMFTGTMAADLLFGTTLGTVTFILTLYMQQLLNFSPLQTGLAFLPMGLTVLVLSNLAPGPTTRLGMRASLAGGCLLVALGSLLLSHIGEQGNYWRDLLPGMLIFALGLPLVHVTSTLVIARDVPQNEQGVASSLWNMTLQIGTALGLAIGVAVISATTSNLAAAHASHAAALAGGFDAGMITNVVFAALSALVGLVLLAKRKRAF